MNVKQKISLLVENRSHQAPPSFPQSTEDWGAGIPAGTRSQRPSAGVTFQPSHTSSRGSEDDADSQKARRQDQALNLWREWAVEALGPMQSEPTEAELSSKSKKAKALERKCAELAARAQRRLAMSASLRNGGDLCVDASMRSTGLHASTSASVPMQEQRWSARELRKKLT